MLQINEYNGFLWVGDPHLWSKTPGKRLKQDFKEIGLNKISQAVDYALKNNLYLIFGGDLFHSDEENDIDLLTKLMRILKKMKGCATIAGNHEKSKTVLTDDVALTLFKEAGVIYTIEENGIWACLNIGGINYYLGGTPYGQKIPNEIENKNNDKIIWFTHHDLDFGKSYPGSQKIKEIKGVNMLINGHFHKTRLPIKVGNMMAFNPGNITRLSIDTNDHIPSIWEWKPEYEQHLEAIQLEYEKDVFDMSSKLVDYKENNEVVEKLSEQQISMFVEKMELSLQNQDKSITDDGIYLKDDIENLANILKISEELKNDLLDIHNSVI